MALSLICSAVAVTLGCAWRNEHSRVWKTAPNLGG
jgi:hypothetical protein